MITPEEFVSFTNSDLKCTNKSEFSLNIVKYKNFVNQVNESIESDKISLNKVKKGVKIIYNSGIGHSQNELTFCELLEKLGQRNDVDFDADGDKVAAGLCKFSVVMRDLSNKYKQLMQNLSSLVVYPLDMFLKGDIKNDAKKPFEKAIKDYEVKAERLKRDRLSALNKENAATIYKPNGDDPFDFSEDLEKERRIVQIQLCEFLMKVNEIKSRKGAELVQQLIDYYRAQTNYFKDSLMMMEHMGMFMNDLVSHIDEIKNKHSEENKLLANTRRELKSSIEKNSKQVVPGTQAGYSLHQPQGNKAYGTSKEGWLLKKSDGMVKRVWQKRRVKLSDQSMMLYHGDDNKTPVILPMLTCHIKHPVGGDSDPLCFDLISNNRTYNFRTEDDKSLEEWLSVLSNAKEAVFERAMSLDPNDDDSFSKDSTCSIDAHSMPNHNMMHNFNNPMISSTISFKNDSDYSPGHNRKILMKTIRKLEGNDKCADCGGLDPEWVSVNLGVLICLECCGVHRELGVHHSRTQSLRMDTFYSSQLLLPRFVGNRLFNDVYEACLSEGVKPPPSDSSNRHDSTNIMQQRRSFIRSKYIDKKYVSGVSGSDKSRLKHDLLLAIQDANIKDLLQAYGEGVDLMEQFSAEDDNVLGGQMNTSIHLALLLAEKWREQSDKRRLSMYDIDWDDSSFKTNTSLLTIIEFILQNSPSTNLKRFNAKGDTILHQAIKCNQLDIIKVILRAGVVCSELISYKNKDKQTAIELAESLNRLDIVDLLNQITNENDKDHTNDILDDLTIDWGVSQDYFPSMVNSNKKCSPNEIHLVKKHDKSHNHIRRGSIGSNKSEASNINFNHYPMLPNEASSQPVKKVQKGAYKSIFSFNANEKIGIKSSANPWNETNLPRKKSLKGPAPEPPPIRNSEGSDQASGNYVGTPVSSRSAPSTRHKPEVAPKPKPVDVLKSNKHATPQPKARTRLSYNPNAYSTATLPRNIRPSHKGILPINMAFSPLAEPEEDQPLHSQTNLKTSSHFSHSSDHIDVLLDVLEEPKKPLNAKEVIHISKPGSLTDKTSSQTNHVPNELKIGSRTTAKYDCEAENRDELSFHKGDVIVVKNQSCEDGWWEGYLEKDPSQSGMFPANFVQKLP